MRYRNIRHAGMVLALALAYALAAVPAVAAPAVTAPVVTAPAVTAGERLAATCTGCHSGQATALPPLAGQPQAVLLASLAAFKSGSRPATIMTQLAKGYTDEQLALIAAWFAAQPGARQ